MASLVFPVATVTVDIAAAVIVVTVAYVKPFSAMLAHSNDIAFDSQTFFQSHMPT